MSDQCDCGTGTALPGEMRQHRYGCSLFVQNSDEWRAAHATQDTEGVRPSDPNPTLIPYLWVEPKTEVCCSYYGSFNDAVYGAQAADTLGLGWRLDAYVGQINDTDDLREWRLVVWKELRSDAIINQNRIPTIHNDGDTHG